MRILSKYSLLIISVMLFSRNCNPQNNNKAIDREPVADGQFYPADSIALAKDLESRFIKAHTKICNNTIAIISPHAGYIFSGEVAASAFNQIDGEKKYENIFIIASSHRQYFDGASVYCDGDYKMPYGNVKVNKELGRLLVEKNPKIFTSDASSHQSEHSIEVQLPFLQYVVKKDYKIVPIIIGTADIEMVKKIASALKPYLGAPNLFVISSDFSHYPDYKDAKLIDKLTEEAIISGKPENLVKTIEANSKKGIKNLSTSLCGWTSVLTLMYMTDKSKLITYHSIQYKNSGDVNYYGDTNRVVGYWAIAITTKADGHQKNDNSFLLDEKEKKQLVEIARNSIINYLKNKYKHQIDTSGFSKSLYRNCGAFVTLHKDGKLRGCIGRFVSDKPLYLVIQDMAIASATQDYRFQPVTSEELNNIEIEISVLSPLEKINSIEEIELGKHGIYIMKNGLGGTFLPQVATETGWTKEEFLGHCAQDKAGIGWSGWKDADIYIYTAIIFSEKDLLQK